MKPPFARSTPQPRHGDLESKHDASERSSLIDFVNIVLFYRRVIIVTVVPVLMIATAIALVQRQSYTSQSSFISQAQGNQSPVSGLAAQLGLSVPSAGVSDNAAFAADLVKSRSVLEAAVQSKYPSGANDPVKQSTLIETYGFTDGSQQSRIDRAVKKLTREVSVSLNQRTGLVTVSVVAPNAPLAQAVNQRLLDLLNDFNLHSRQSQARTERVFAERRLEEVAGDLRAAEDRLEAFLEANRNYMSSPTLMFQRERLTRSVAEQQGLHATLLQSFERAKIDEVRDTPVITVVDRPSFPARPDSRAILVIKALFWVFLALAIGVGVAFMKARFNTRRRSSSPEVREFDRLMTEVNREFMLPFRKVKRVFARG